MITKGCGRRSPGGITSRLDYSPSPVDWIETTLARLTSKTRQSPPASSRCQGPWARNRAGRDRQVEVAHALVVPMRHRRIRDLVVERGEQSEPWAAHARR